MKYAILNGERIEPKKGITDAVCPVCKENVIPKCGNIKMHHWAHKSKQNCDPWGKNETEWHRKWKDCFPEEYQEIVMYDGATGEKHVADVRTNTGIVIEFQHSAMKREEQSSRENFYKKMVWVVDASKSYVTFKTHMKMLEKSEVYKGHFRMTLASDELSQSCFPERWLESSVPVIFDFGVHNKSDGEEDKQKKWLYCIFPEKIAGHKTIYCGMYMTKEEFINKVSNSDSFFPNLEFPELERQRLERLKALQEEEKRMEEEYKKEMEEEERRRREENQAIFQKKYPKQKRWRAAIFELRDKIEQGIFKPIKLYVSDNGKLTDYNNSEEYNDKKCMVLSIKYFTATYNGREYTKNSALLLIEHKDRIVFAIANIPTYIVSTEIHDGFDYDYWWSYRIRITKVIPYRDRFQLSFELDDTLWHTKIIRESIQYIDNQFSNSNK